jgi:ubiquinone/menaquinone biosynthesis C-methylase UbiE
MPDWPRIFAQHATEYEQIVAREDHARNLPQALGQICAFEGLDVIELGAGTGRFTCMLAPQTRRIVAFDTSPPMLERAVARLKEIGLRNWTVGVADHRHLPVGNRTADVAIAGWTLGVFPGQQPETWRSDIELALAQMERVLRPGGTAIIVETLGTGYEAPQPPPPLAPYYAYLEGERGFRSTWIRTDYQFESLAEAEHLTRFFYGDALADRLVERGSLVLPECTGIWWRTV